jgi:hypothetical protein
MYNTTALRFSAKCHVRSREAFCRSTHGHSEVIDESKRSASKAPIISNPA